MDCLLDMCRFLFLKKIKSSYKTLCKVKTPLFLDHKGPKVKIMNLLKESKEMKRFKLFTRSFLFAF